MKRDQNYRRIPGLGSGMSLGSRSQLLLAKDHLMLVTMPEFSALEEYSRFYFRDIRAVTARRSPDGALMSVALLLVAATFMFIGYAIAFESGLGGMIFGGIGFAFLAGMVINMARGHTCKCYIHTAVQTQRLHPIRRFAQIDRLLHTLRPMIDASQGSLDQAEAVERLSEERAVPSQFVQAAPVDFASPPAHAARGNLHLTMFWLLVIGAPASFLLAVIGQAGGPMGAVAGVVHLGWAFALAVVTCWAYAVQRHTGLPEQVKKATGWSFGLVLVNGFWAYFEQTVINVRMQTSPEADAVLALRGQPALIFLGIIAAVSIVLGVYGLGNLLRWRATALPPSAPTEPAAMGAPEEEPAVPETEPVPERDVHPAISADTADGTTDE